MCPRGWRPLEDSAAGGPAGAALHGDDITVALAAGLVALLLLESAKLVVQPFFSVRNTEIVKR